jgi:hypothetical protein
MMANSYVLLGKSAGDAGSVADLQLVKGAVLDAINV